MTEKQSDIKLFRFSLELIKYKPLQFIWNVFGSILFFFTQLAIALVVREIFNNLLDEPTYGLGIWTLVLLIPLAYFIRIVVDVLNVISEFTFVQSTQALVRTNIMEGVFEQPGAAALASSPGESISRFRGDSMELTWFVNFIAIITSFSIFSIIFG